MINDILKLIAAIAMPLLLIQFCSKRLEKQYSISVEIQYCNNGKDTLQTVAYAPNGLKIHNIKRAVPELRVSEGLYSAGYVVDYNVCDFNIISSKRIK